MFKAPLTELLVIDRPGEYALYDVVDRASGYRLSTFTYRIAAEVYARNAVTCPCCDRLIVGAYDTDDHRAGRVKRRLCEHCWHYRVR